MYAQDHVLVRLTGGSQGVIFLIEGTIRGDSGKPGLPGGILGWTPCGNRKRTRGEVTRCLYRFAARRIGFVAPVESCIARFDKHFDKH